MRRSVFNEGPEDALVPDNAPPEIRKATACFTRQANTTAWPVLGNAACVASIIECSRCGHRMHVKCGEIWFQQRRTCPYCSVADDGGNVLEIKANGPVTLRYCQPGKPSQGTPSRLTSTGVGKGKLAAPECDRSHFIVGA
ncbi:hypothetical protein EMIHUDRAFT_222638 [Emiliania huxleyi CCMP1516]|uniref:RING-type domain-containing protein n=2 Tax=Emiliania huxleyi TaxID=2903 RepID=A0A0D3KXQ4_EMIH1|nr:hypothetical protein EMIHUDRAFT_222638 [Emiliania huxleyi CCMP1516]EOD40539.1 hypothetical protein EMIHUDRAFT_222638 [Emiliania huxleyi CCMP1516]|eukprot:XP_005792968.1 hypothetical protein EMIHUDRAFT_222638 [Emiliania huxleyi CCMP1516]